MLNKSTTFMVGLLLVLFTNAYAHQATNFSNEPYPKLENAQNIEYSDRTPIPNYIKFDADKRISERDFDKWLQNFFKDYSSKPTFELKKTNVDRIGFTHSEYHQYINNIPVSFAKVKAHAKDGEIHLITGEIYPSVVNTSSASLSESQALNGALRHIGAEVYKWQLKGEEEHLKAEQEDVSATYFPKGELTYVYDGNQPSREMKLAYKFKIYAHTPVSHREIWIDATSGKVLFENQLICEANQPGTAHTGYSGVRTIMADRVNNNRYRLRETGRGSGNVSINTYNMRRGINYNNAVDFIDTDNVWNNVNQNRDQYATDAHWAHEMVVDYFWEEHGWNSINGNGMAVNGYVHYDNNYVNAFWDNYRVTYGDGNSNIMPLVTIDICGHEISHGVTHHSAGLIYEAESGALNESFSDIFGNSIEYFAKPNDAQWTVGEGSIVIRNMANPKSMGDPNTYHGQYWVNTSNTSEANDYGGVHSNSGVQNFWYYLLVEGGSGTNDNNQSYNVTSIGWEAAAAIAFRTLTVYLGPNSNYSAARSYSIQAAEDLYGPCSQELISTTNAWHAVGVGSAYSGGAVSSSFAVESPTTWCEVPFTVDFQNTGSVGSGISYSWDFGDGNTSTSQNPSHTYTSFGDYDVSLTVSSSTCGSSTEDKTDYISINPDYDCFDCDTLNFPPPGTLTVYGTSQGGFMTGWNGYEDKSMANIFDNYGNYSEVTGAFVYFYGIKDGGNNTQIELNVWNNNGQDGRPGTKLKTQSISLQDLSSSLTGGAGVVKVNFDEPVAVTSPYYIGISMVNFQAGDSLGIVSNTIGDSPNMLWIQNGNDNWNSFPNEWGSTSLTLFVSPMMTSTPPIAVIDTDELTVCAGGTITFDASNSENVSEYYWNFEGGDIASSTDEEVIVSFDTPGTYSVDLAVVGGCSGVDTESVQITVTPGINLSVSASSTTVCAGESVTLTASGANSYSWNNGLGNGSTKTVSPTETTTYEVTGTSAGCSVVETIEIIVAPELEFSVVASASTICSGESVTLTASGASNYTWDNGLGNGATKTVSPTQTTTYEVVGTTGGCSGTETIQIVVNPSPTVGITASSVDICEGESVTLSANGANSYMWANGLGWGANKTVSPNVTTTYQVTGTSGGCTDVETIEIVVSPAPDVSVAASSTTICSGESVTLTASGASNYSWNHGLGNGAIKTVSPNQTTTYQVTGSSGSCTDIETIQIVVNPSPTVGITASSTVICAGESVTLVANGANSYMWANGLGWGASKTVTPTETTTYQVTGTSGGCTDVEIVEIEVIPSVDVQITASELIICEGESITLTASGASDYSWSNGLGSGDTKIITPTQTTTYQVTGSVGSCSDVETIEITVVPQLNIDLTASSTAICEGESVTLTASGADDYSWSNGLGSGTVKTVFPTETTTYEVTGVNEHCSDVKTVEIVVNPIPNVQIASTATEICQGDNIILTASGADNYSWNNGLGNNAIQTVSPSVTTTYEVTGTTNGCTSVETIEVVVVESLNVQITASSLEVCEGESVTLTASGASEYTWDNGLGNGVVKTVTPTQTTTYQVTGTSSSCSDVTTIEIVVNPSVNVSLTASSLEVCEGESVTLTASGAGEYTWDNGLGNGAVQTVSPTQTTTYQVTGETGNCSDVKSIKIVVNPSPAVEITASATEICAGGEVVLTASGAANYSWSNGLGNNGTITVSPAETTIYTITGSTGNCSDVETIEIVVVPSINIEITASDFVICEGGSVTLTASGASDYTWDNGLGSGATQVVSPTETTTYQVTGTSGDCSGVQTIEITVSESINVTLVADQAEICAGEEVVLTVSGAGNYEWNNGLGNGSSITVSPTETTTYEVVGTSGDCSGIANVEVVVSPELDINIVSTKTEICEGESVTFIASGASTYVWDEQGSGAVLTVFPTQSTTYNVTGVNFGETCFGQASIDITVNELPVVFVEVDNSVICYGDTVYITASGANDYSWTPEDGLVQASGASVVAIPGQSVDYTVIGTNDCGMDYATVHVDVYDYPQTPIINQVGDQLSVNLQNGETAEWFFNGISVGYGSSITMEDDGHYEVVVSNMGGCAVSSEGEFVIDTTGISMEDIVNNLVVYPNPTNGITNVKWDYAIEMEKVVVLDAIGRVVLVVEGSNSNNMVSIDLSSFETGVYILEMVTNRGNITRKVTKR